MSWSTSELRVRLAPLNRFKPSSKIFYWPFQGGTSFVDLLCFCSVLCLLCLCTRLFICALWSPAGKGLTSWLSFVVSNCEFVTLSQSFEWYRPFSIPWHLSLHFLKECFCKVGVFMKIIWYYGIIRSGSKWSGKCMVHWLMDTIYPNKDKTMWFPTLLWLPSWTSS